MWKPQNVRKLRKLKVITPVTHIPCKSTCSDIPCPATSLEALALFVASKEGKMRSY